MEIAVSRNVPGKKALVALTALAVLGSTSAAWSFFDVRHDRGGYVLPCSLDGVNPVYHPYIFGNPALARSFGFVQARDGSWHVIPGCSRY
jgi:hypothetical protein